MTAFRDLPATIVGELGEAAGASLMREDGASMIALCRIDTGGAPVLERGKTSAPSRNLVLPDFQAFNWRGQSACFVEIKTYAQSAHNKKFGLRIHGIPVRLYEHYRKVELDTGLRVVLGVNELDTGELRLTEQSITAIARFPCICKGRCESVNSNVHVPNLRGIREMQWYFDRDDFTIVYRHSSRTIDTLRREHSRRIGGHAWSRHAFGAGAVDPIALPGTPAPCGHCGAFDNAKTVFVVGNLDKPSDRFVLCDACWHTGVTPELSKRIRALGWRP